MSRLQLVAVLATVTALGGCSPTSTWAVKLTPTGLPQLIDNACDSPKVESVQIRVLDGDEVLDEKDPVIWRIAFPRPTQLREITVGQKPAGAENEIAWQPPKGDQRLVMSVQRENADTSDIQFTLDELKDGNVYYEFKYLTADEFAKKRASC
jgi:hypothetical protein